MLEPTWAMARPGSGQPFVICAGPAQERFSFIGKMKTFVLLARPEFLLSSATGAECSPNYLICSSITHKKIHLGFVIARETDLVAGD
jgi:hypothetical protein